MKTGVLILWWLVGLALVIVLAVVLLSLVSCYRGRRVERAGRRTKLLDGPAETPSRPVHGRGGCLNFNVQFRTNAGKQSINSALIAWDSTDSPWTKLATINIYPQEFDTPEQWQFCQNMTYNPGHSLWEHRHIEGLNRARVRVMHAMQEIRLHRNELPRFEPTGNEVFYPGATFPWLRPPRRAAGRFE